MTWLWIFNAVVLLVIVPVVLVLLARVIMPALDMKRGADHLAASGDSLAAHFGGVEQLTRTRELVREVATELERYGQALDRLR
jgi:hypothetical protein